MFRLDWPKSPKKGAVLCRSADLSEGSFYDETEVAHSRKS